MRYPRSGLPVDTTGESPAGIAGVHRIRRRRRLTVAAIERLRPPAGGRLEYWDDQVGGLGLRISESGRKTWFWFGRIRGRGGLVRITLGPFPAVDLVKARELARETLYAALRGADPRETRRRAEQELERTFGVVAREFIDRYVKRDKKLRTAGEVERRIERYLIKAWDKKPIAEVSRADVHALLDELIDDGMAAGANRVFATARKLFNWCVCRGYVAASPCVGVSAPVKENRRERVLDDNEIRDIWNAALKAPSDIFGRFTRMLISTAQRRSEVAQMRWQDLNLERQEWTIPAEFYKGGSVHVVPLNDAARSILRDSPLVEGCPWVFTGNGRTPISGFNAAKRQVDALANKVEPWTFHDLRRTAASKMTEFAIPRLVVERVLGHRDRSLAATYDRYDYLPEKRAAMTRWGKGLAQILASKTTKRADKGGIHPTLLQAELNESTRAPISRNPPTVREPTTVAKGARGRSHTPNGSEGLDRRLRRGLS